MTTRAAAMRPRVRRRRALSAASPPENSPRSLPARRILTERRGRASACSPCPARLYSKYLSFLSWPLRHVFTLTHRALHTTPPTGSRRALVRMARYDSQVPAHAAFRSGASRRSCSTPTEKLLGDGEGGKAGASPAAGAKSKVPLFPRCRTRQHALLQSKEPHAPEPPRCLSSTSEPARPAGCLAPR